MAVAHGSTTVATGTTDPITISNHVVSGKDVVLIVKVAIGSSIVVVSGITWNGNENFILVKRELGNDARSELWFLANPTIKTSDVVVDLPSAGSRVVVAASTYTGVDKVEPLRLATAASANGTDDSPTVGIVTLNTDMVVDSLCQVSEGPDTAVGDHTERHDDSEISIGNDVRGASQEKASIGGTVTMGWTMSNADDWALVAVPLRTPLADGYTAMGHFGLVKPALIRGMI